MIEEEKQTGLSPPSTPSGISRTGKAGWRQIPYGIGEGKHPKEILGEGKHPKEILYERLEGKVEATMVNRGCPGFDPFSKIIDSNLQ